MMILKLMSGQRLSMAALMVAALFSSSAHTQELDIKGCKKNCLAQKAIANFKTYNLDLKTRLADPLGSEVCKNQLKGLVSKLKGKDVCLFKDSSSIELTSLHLYSERFARPVP